MSSIEVARLSPVMSNRKLQVLSFIRAYHARHGEGPSLSEIAAACRTSRPRVQDAIRKLTAEGRIHRVPGQARGVRPLDEIDEALRQLRAVGYSLAAPGGAAPLVDLDAQGRIVVIQSAAVTNASLPGAAARAHDAPVAVSRNGGEDGDGRQARQERQAKRG